MLEKLIDEPNLRLASVLDIAGMKLVAITSRVSNKDYIDLFYILQEMDLKDLLERVLKKFSDIDKNLKLKIHLSMFKKYQPNFRNKFSNSSAKGRGNFKVRGPIKSFRDLDVYNKSTELSADIFTLQAPKDLGLGEEVELLKNISKHVPKMIAESYGNRFDNFAVAERKLEKTAEVITAVISKLDFIISIIKKIKEQEASDTNEDSKKIENTEVVEFEKKVNQLLKDYSINRTKVLNLKRSWIRLNEKFGKKI